MICLCKDKLSMLVRDFSHIDVIRSVSNDPDDDRPNHASRTNYFFSTIDVDLQQKKISCSILLRCGLESLVRMRIADLRTAHLIMMTKISRVVGGSVATHAAWMCSRLDCALRENLKKRNTLRSMQRKELLTYPLLKLNTLCTSFLYARARSDQPPSKNGRNANNQQFVPCCA